MSHFYCYAECCYAESRYAESRYAECRYAECRGVLNVNIGHLLSKARPHLIKKQFFKADTSQLKLDVKAVTLFSLIKLFSP
jgi:hypothetical protein